MGMCQAREIISSGTSDKNVRRSFIKHFEKSEAFFLYEKGSEAVWSKNTRKEEKLNTEDIDNSQFKGKCNTVRDETILDILNRSEERCSAGGNEVMKILN